MVMSLVTELVLGAAPPERAGVASALTESSSEFGGALGMAILGSVGAAVYRRRSSTACRPGCPPTPLTRPRRPWAVRSRSAQGLPADLADAVLHAAGSRSPTGCTWPRYAAMVVMVLGAVTALVTLRGVRPADSAALAAEPTGPAGTSLSSVSR